MAVALKERWSSKLVDLVQATLLAVINTQHASKDEVFDFTCCLFTRYYVARSANFWAYISFYIRIIRFFIVILEDPVVGMCDWRLISAQDH